MFILLLISLSNINCNKNIIKNPSFEELNSKNRLMDWAVDSLTDLSSDSHSGNYSLHWKQTNKIVYNSQNLQLDKDFSYEVCVHFKLKDIVGKGFRFYIGNLNYTPGFIDYHYSIYYNGTNDWKKACYNTNKIFKPNGYLDKYIFIFSTSSNNNTKGEVFIDDISIIRINDYINITINNDREEVYDKVNVVYELNIKKGNYTLNDWNLIIRIKDNNNIISEKTIKSIKSSFSTIPIDIKNLNLINNKFYQVEVVLKCLKDETINIKTYTFKKINKIERKVTFDEYGRMFINNELFFPFGLYVPYGRESELKEINRTHLNFILPCFECYRKTIENTMNLINITQNGRIKVLFHVKDVIKTNTSTCEVLNEEEDYKIFVNRINEFKNSPILIGWYINDEMPECLSEHIRNRTLTIHELDPDHPTISVTNKRNLKPKSFINTTDVFGVDCYPIGYDNITEPINCYDRHKEAYDGLLKSKPMWPVPQIFDWSAITKLGFDTRPPTLQEMKCMTWQALVAGAKGLIFYSIIEIIGMNKTTPFESRWKDVIELTDHIWKYKDMILSIEKVHQIEYKENHNIAFKQWKYNGYNYIVITNLGRKNEKLEINLIKKYIVVKEFGLGTFKQHNNNITFNIEPIDALMIKYKLDNSSNSILIIILVIIILIIISIIIIYLVKRYYKKVNTKKFIDKIEPLMNKNM